MMNCTSFIVATVYYKSIGFRSFDFQLYKMFYKLIGKKSGIRRIRPFS
jgi:hypothetical protein